MMSNSSGCDVIISHSSRHFKFGPLFGVTNSNYLSIAALLTRLYNSVCESGTTVTRTVGNVFNFSISHYVISFIDTDYREVADMFYKMTGRIIF